MSKKASYFLLAIVAALASFAGLYAGRIVGGGMQIVLAVLGVMAIGAAGGLIALGLRANRES